MFNRLPLRSKILLFLLPALAYIIGVSAVLILQSFQLTQKAGAIDVSADYFQYVSGVINGMQKERGLSSVFLSTGGGRDTLETHRRVVDESIVKLKSIFPSVNDSIRDRTETLLRDHGEARKLVEGKGPVPEVIGRYSAVIGALIQL